jgi:hypothetical protein
MINEEARPMGGKNDGKRDQSEGRDYGNVY